MFGPQARVKRLFCKRPWCHRARRKIVRAWSLSAPSQRERAAKEVRFNYHVVVLGACIFHRRHADKRGIRHTDIFLHTHKGVYIGNREGLRSGFDNTLQHISIVRKKVCIAGVYAKSLNAQVQAKGIARRPRRHEAYIAHSMLSYN